MRHDLPRSAVRILAVFAVTCALPACSDAPPRVPAPAAPAAPLATFTVREHLGHRWEDELLHFDFDVAGAGEPWLSGPGGEPVLSQIEGLRASGGRLQGRVWTVASLAPRGTLDLALHAGAAGAPSTPGAWIAREGGELVLANERVAVALPEMPGEARGPFDLAALPPPVRAVRAGKGPWLGGAAWVREGPPLAVIRASTEVVEAGPVRVTVRQRLSFADGRAYTALVSLAARQDVALITEDADVRAPGASLRLSMQPGLGADHVFYRVGANAPKAVEGGWGMLDTAAPSDREEVLCHLRPWTFWWHPNVGQWAGFHAGGGTAPLVGVVALRPSRWRPSGWDGFDRTAIPVTARLADSKGSKGGGVDLTFVLDARRAGHDDDPPLHREWALTAGTAAEHVTTDSYHVALRRLLVKHSEWPLDEVKDVVFDFPRPAREHPSLLFTRADIERVRRQAKTDPHVREVIEHAVTYLFSGGDFDATLRDCPAMCFERFMAHAFQDALPTAYVGSDDPRFGRFLGGVVDGLARKIVSLFLEAPERPSLGALGPWYTAYITELALFLDLVAGTPYLTPEKEAEARSVLVLGARALAHPDYWNGPLGMASANPNMSIAIYVPRGLLGLALAGHPEAGAWLASGEEALESDVAAGISPGGAWVENPYYQLASLDTMMLLAQGLKQAGRRDYFADPRLRADLDYFGFILTAPDRRFPVPKGEPPTAIIPEIGDTFAGIRSPYNGWMAAATARTDPAYSARQQFFWQLQSRTLEYAGRAAPAILVLTDPSLPAAPPEETSAAFPGFGSVMRSSWTDPRQSYVAHRTGPNVHHYHADQGSFVYYAKGAPLCLDWGNYYTPQSRGEPAYHNMVTFSKADRMEGALVAVRALPGFVSWSHGTTSLSNPEKTDRHILLVQAPDPMGANYLVIRDRTVDGQAPQTFTANFWVLADRPEVKGASVHFPGRMGVDLDLSVLSPRSPSFAEDHWAWKQVIHGWGEFSEDQWGVHVTKLGSAEDFFTVLYPRAGAEPAAGVTALEGGVGARVVHGEGTDVVLCSPGRPATVRDGDVELEGEVAMARRARSGVLRLALLARGSASVGGWGLAGDGPIAIEIAGGAVTGLSRGEAHGAVITLPRGFGAAVVLLDGKPIPAARDGQRVRVELPAGAHALAVRRGA
jgi:hypothetical protein